MITNLKAKLRAISSSSRSNEYADLKPRDRDRGDFGGRVVDGAGGRYVLKTALHGLDSSFGIIPLKTLICADFSDSSWWARLDVDIDIKDVVFLDTETTGLAGGTGTMAFLIGLGHIEDGGLVIRQYLARDFDEEYAVLAAVLEDLKGCGMLITFNGKAFDWPLLESRLIYSRLRPLNWEGRHLDLLHVARRLWGDRLDSCSLASLEENILGHSRPDDIPGSLIPGIYLKYLETGETGDMVRVIKHNEWDILAMAALLARVAPMFRQPAVFCDDVELLGVAKDLERAGRVDEACRCYRACIDRTNIGRVRTQAQKKLAFLVKRHQGSGAAMDIWAEMASSQGSIMVLPLIEMAKHFEHKEKDIDSALKLTEQALSIVYRQRPAASENIYEDLLHRRARLLRKKGRVEGSWV